MFEFTITLTGYLNKFRPEPTIVKANTAREAIDLFQNYMPKGVRHFVRVLELSCEAAFDERRATTITIEPILMGAGGGSKKSAGIQIGIGIFLIALAVTGFGAVGLAKLGVTKGALILTGAQLVLGGVLQLLQKAPKADPTQGDKKSRFINGSGNTIEEGTPIPLIYGRQKVFGQILSFDIDADEYDPR